MDSSLAKHSAKIEDHELEWLLSLASSFQASQRPLPGARNPRVLLAGDEAHRWSFLASRLRGQGCACEFVFSFTDACSRLEAQAYDLMLTPLELSDGSSFPLVSRLQGAAITLFYSVPVENGCWWLPALRNGRNCFGSPALLPSEFIAVLEEIIEEICRGPEGKKKELTPSINKIPPVLAVLPAEPKRPTVITKLRRKIAG